MFSLTSVVRVVWVGIDVMFVIVVKVPPPKWIGADFHKVGQEPYLRPFRGNCSEKLEVGIWILANASN